VIEVLGISRQAAFQRFGKPADPRTGRPMASAMLPGAAERGAALVADLVAGRWAQVCRDFDARVAQQRDADGMAAGWARLTGMIGLLEHMGEPVAYQAGDLTLGSLTSIRLGSARFQHCPVGDHWSLVRPVPDSDLTAEDRRMVEQTP
jgi:hypothetical protein